jgi:hypothetical protein
VISHQIYAIQHLKVNLVIMQVVWDKIDYAGGEVHLPSLLKHWGSSSKTCSSSAPTGCSLETATMSMSTQEYIQQTKQYTKHEKLKERRFGFMNANTKALGTIGSFG